MYYYRAISEKLSLNITAMEQAFSSRLLPQYQNESKCETIHMKMSSACSFFFMQIKVIFIRMVSHFFKCVFQDPTLADELGDNLIRKGTEHFTNNRFKEAAEYFTEVIRVVCKFSLVRDAYVYQAKCHVELVSVF